MAYRNIYKISGLILLVGSMTLGCTQAVETDRAANPGGGASGGQGPTGGGDTPAPPNAAAGSGGAASGGGFANQEEDPPGRYLVDPMTPGENACAGTSLDTVLRALRTTHPDLVDVTTIYNPGRQAVGDGSFIYPYQRSGGGFAIAIKRGLGDCSAGCTDNFYDYFETDAACVPGQVGSYHAAWGRGSCLAVEGAPRWGHPPPPDPSIVCGADNRPHDLRGTYSFQAQGQSQSCGVSGDKANVNEVDVTLTLTLEQDFPDLATGTVTIDGSGHALLDGVAVPAKFLRRRFEADRQVSSLPGACPREHNVTVFYDFETDEPGTLMLTEFGTDSCMCKGVTNLALTRLR